MALHLPGKRTTPTSVAAVGVDGLTVHVASAAVDGARGAAESSPGMAMLTTTDTVRAMATDIGRDGLRRAAIDAGRPAPSDRTLRRWIQQNRIPHDDVTTLVGRRTAIQRLGGVTAAARAIGRTPASVAKYRSGATRQLRRDAAAKLRAAVVDRKITTAGLVNDDGSTKRAVVRVSGTVGVRNGDDTGYDFRTRTLDFGNSAEPMSEDVSRQLAAAVANGDHDRVVAIIERHATLDYPEASGFDAYSDTLGFHFDSIDDIDIDWH